MSRKEGFLDRWSRLKETGETPDVETMEAAVSAVATAETAEVDERSDEEILAELGLPDPDDLTLGDDVAGFMSKAVPDRLRRKALRQLWRANPVLANLDGLVEYGEDYTDSAMVIENLQTLYQVGKGMFVEPAEPEVADDEGEGEGEDEIAPTDLAEAENTEETPQIADADDDADAGLADESIVEVEHAHQPEGADISETPPQPTLRRMTFS